MSIRILAFIIGQSDFIVKRKKNVYEIVINNENIYEKGELIISKDSGRTWDHYPDKNISFEINYLKRGINEKK